MEDAARHAWLYQQIKAPSTYSWKRESCLCRNWVILYHFSCRIFCSRIECSSFWVEALLNFAGCTLYCLFMSPCALPCNKGNNKNKVRIHVSYFTLIHVRPESMKKLVHLWKKAAHSLREIKLLKNLREVPQKVRLFYEETLHDLKRKLGNIKWRGQLVIKFRGPNYVIITRD